ncbi:hypothetical protein KFQ04_24535 [Pseudomonas synxantha]|nr:hypothetical protein KFQ04_24535 [Pseudomonas synxantha]
MPLPQVRGSAHSGNVAAAGLAGEKLLDILSSGRYLAQVGCCEALPGAQQAWRQAKRVF